MKISIRKRKLKDNKTALFIEFYKSYSKDYQGKIKHDREFLTLDLQIYTVPENKEQENYNQELLNKADIIKKRYEREFFEAKHLNGKPFKIPQNQKQKPFLQPSVSYNLGKLKLPEKLNISSDKTRISVFDPKFGTEEYFNGYECTLQFNFSGNQIFIDYITDADEFLSEIFDLDNDFLAAGNFTTKFSDIQNEALEILSKYL